MSLSAQVPRVFRFGVFEVDPREGELRKSGLRIKLQDQPLQLLVMLLERPGEIVTREELQRRLWSADTFVDFDHSLNSAIKKLREALGDQSENPRFIETLHRRGYRFIAPVETQNSADFGTTVLVSGTPSSGAIRADVKFAPRSYGKRAKVLTSAVIAAIAVLVILSLNRVREGWLGRRNPPRIQSLAVLPLVNLSSDASQDYFTDGMTEELTTDLGKISALRVISRTSAMQYKGTKKSLPEIARELNVDAVVEGTVARSGSHLRITANLLQASPEKHLWADSYESEVGDILTVQGRVAQAVAREIQVKLTPEEQKLLGKAQPVNPHAHDDYLKGRYLCNNETREGLDRAIQYFQQAIEKAPNDPLAYAGLANCYAISGWAGDIFGGDLSPKEMMAKARDAALKALQLDEASPEAHTSLADVELILNWNWSGAEREFKRAIELNSNYSPAHVCYAHYLVAMGRFDESVVEAKRALELDPFSKFTMDFATWAFSLARRYDLTVQQSQKSLEFAPEFPWAHYELGEVKQHTGSASESVQEFMQAEELFGMSQERLAELRGVYHQSGEKGYWRKMLALCREASKKTRKLGSPSGYGSCDYMKNASMAALQVRSGELNAAFESLEKAYAKHEVDLIYLKVDPSWDNLRSDPRFQDLMRRVGLTN
jgi:TolB-like protein/DNA-binding winged helix-turn-helix (wHTH) protein/Tfp pilus assembly protein PilF